MKANNYFVFGDDSKAALEFYRKAPGIKVLKEMMFQDKFGEQWQMTENDVFYSELLIGQMKVTLSGARHHENQGSINIEFSPEEGTEPAMALYNYLKEGGTVFAEAAPLAFVHSQMFAYIKDKFGIHWQFVVKEPGHASTDEGLKVA